MAGSGLELKKDFSEELQVMPRCLMCQFVVPGLTCTLFRRC